MFSRIQEALRIITYREPETGEDAVIVEREVPTVPRAGRVISRVLEFLVVVYGLGYVAGRIGEVVPKIVPSTHSVSVTTIAGAVGALLMFMVHSLRDDVEKKIKAHINLADELAPYFGHRLDNTLRILKG